MRIKPYLFVYRNILKGYKEFKWDLINPLLGDTVEFLLLLTIWTAFFSLNKSFLGLSFKTFLYFLVFKEITEVFVILVIRSSGILLEYVRGGGFTDALLKPLNPFLYFFIRHSFFPVGRVFRVIYSLIAALIFGLDPKKLLFGIILSIFSGLLLALAFSFIGILSAVIDIDLHYFGELLYKFSRYPTHIYRGVLFFLSNLLVPAFLLGTFQLILSVIKIKEFVFIYSIISAILFPALILLNKIFSKKLLMKYEAYGA